VLKFVIIKTTKAMNHVVCRTRVLSKKDVSMHDHLPPVIPEFDPATQGRNMAQMFAGDQFEPAHRFELYPSHLNYGYRAPDTLPNPAGNWFNTPPICGPVVHIETPPYEPFVRVPSPPLLPGFDGWTPPTFSLDTTRRWRFSDDF
jgi:hypothetical protein